MRRPSCETILFSLIFSRLNIKLNPINPVWLEFDNCCRVWRLDKPINYMYMHLPKFLDQLKKWLWSDLPTCRAFLSERGNGDDFWHPSLRTSPHFLASLLAAIAKSPLPPLARPSSYTTSKSLFHQCLKNYLGCWWNLSSLRMICWMWKVGTIFALTCFRVHHQTLKQNVVQGVFEKSWNASSQITRDHNVWIYNISMQATKISLL